MVPPPEVCAGALVSGRYRIDGLIGQGGMGAVFRATDVSLGEVVALKFLLGRALPTTRQLERFLGEIKVVRRIQHKAVVHGYDIGEWEGLPYIVMQYVDGRPLSGIVAQRGRLPLSDVLPIAAQVIAGLKAAHDEGIVHRDLKTDNILLDRAGAAYILDFGIARRMDGARLTMAGEILGSPLYIAPEQARGREVDHRADIYSLGVILFELLTGELPYGGHDALAIALQHVLQPPVSPRSREPSIPAHIDRAILKCLQKDPSDRYADATHLLADLLDAPAGARTPTARNAEPFVSRPPSVSARNAQLSSTTPNPSPAPANSRRSWRIGGESFYSSHRARSGVE
jgi:serine/threonine-protein kinase